MYCVFYVLKSQLVIHTFIVSPVMFLLTRHMISYRLGEYPQHTIARAQHRDLFCFCVFTISVSNMITWADKCAKDSANCSGEIKVTSE